MVSELENAEVIDEHIVYLANPEMKNVSDTLKIKTYLQTRNIIVYDAMDLTSFIEFHFGGCQLTGSKLIFDNRNLLAPIEIPRQQVSY
jgi:hypothetical protein